MKNLILLLSCILMFTGCMTQKKQQRIAHSYFSLHPDELAKICSSKYPAETKFIKGEMVTKIDTVRDSIPVQVDCPDGSKADCPPNKKIIIDNSRVDTLEVLPTAVKAQLIDQITQIRDADVKIIQLERDLEKQKQKTDTAEHLAQRRLFIIIALGALMGLGIFLRIKNVF